MSDPVDRHAGKSFEESLVLAEIQLLTELSEREAAAAKKAGLKFTTALEASVWAFNHGGKEERAAISQIIESCRQAGLTIARDDPTTLQ